MNSTYANILALRLPNDSQVIIDKKNGKLNVYPHQLGRPVLKVESLFDILAIRDILNDAYPPEVYVSDNMRRVSKGS